jgi:hypothetical protein
MSQNEDLLSLIVINLCALQWYTKYGKIMHHTYLYDGSKS